MSEKKNYCIYLKKLIESGEYGKVVKAEFSRKSPLHASEAMHQPPRGERLTSQTFGPSGMQERLNCWLKNLLMKVFNHFFMVWSS